MWTAFSGIALEDGDEKKLFFTETFFGEDWLQEAAYMTWDAAAQGHRAIVERYREKLRSGGVVSFAAGD